MKKLSLFVSLLMVSACSHQPMHDDVASAPSSRSSSATAIHQGAVLAGDYPDPSLIRVGQTYWAVATSSAWAPIFPIFKSSDLANWKVVAAVFQKQPMWSKGDYWAPEIAQLNKSFYVYYAARNKKTSKMCVGVATAAAPNGPYQDHGPIVCGAIGSIDPAPVVDDNGDKYLVWKEDGNSIGKPTPLNIQKLSADGVHLVGAPTQAITNDAAWERNLVEAPFILKHEGLWYLFYSANGCCGRDCNYALGVARAKTLAGPWLKNPQNPILRGNDRWKCPGHGSIVQDGQGRDILLYHAYDSKDSVYVGRQAMADQVDWSKNGSGDVWPTINNDHGPSNHQNGFLNHIPRNDEWSFSDDFSSGELAPGYQWPKDREPRYKISSHDQRSELILTTESSSTDDNAIDYTRALVARSATMGSYTAVVKLNVGAMSSTSVAGLAAYGDSKNSIGVSYVNKHLDVWTRDSGKTFGVEQIPLTQATGQLWLKMIVENGETYHFAYSEDGSQWHEAGSLLRDGHHLPPWDLGVRVALTAGAGEAHFAAFKIEARLL